MSFKFCRDTIVLLCFVILTGCASISGGGPDRTSKGAHKSVIVLVGQSLIAASDALIYPGEAETDDLATKGDQTEADKAALFAFNLPPGLSYGWGDIRGHDGSKLGKFTNPEGLPYKVGGHEIGINRTLYDDYGYRDLAIFAFYSNYNAEEDGHSAYYVGKSRYVAWTAALDARLAELTAMGYTYTIIALVIHQGIDDGRLHRFRVYYERDWQASIAAFRATYSVSDLPVFFARSINSTMVGARYMDRIREGQVAMGEDFNGWIDTDDLTPYVNTHHLSFKNQLLAGNRFGKLIRASVGYQDSRGVYRKGLRSDIDLMWRGLIN